MSKEEIEAWFLDHDDPVFEIVIDASHEADAFERARMELVTSGKSFSEKDLWELVRKWRSLP